MRKTLKVEVEVTIETNFPHLSTSEGLADELRDRVFAAIEEDAAYETVLMTVTGVEE